MAQDVTSGTPTGTQSEVEASLRSEPEDRTQELPAISVVSPVADPVAEPARRSAAVAGRRDLRELRDPTRGVRKGVKAMLSRLWRLPVGPTPKEIEDIVREVKVHHPRADVREMVRAFELARVAHEGQLRKSGELFIQHPIGVARILARLGMDAGDADGVLDEQLPIGVARILARLGMDSTTIVGALLHDAVEDTDVELVDIEQSFGPEVALIIDGLTKLDKIQFRTKEQERAENLRKMIVAMAKDLRVLIIKLADRLHNMRTLTALAPAKREHVATETLEIYAPLADRLGMQPIRAELEDLAFKTLHAKPYEEIQQMVAQRAPEREVYLQRVIDEVQARLREVRAPGHQPAHPD